MHMMISPTVSPGRLICFGPSCHSWKPTTDPDLSQVEWILGGVILRIHENRLLVSAHSWFYINLFAAFYEDLLHARFSSLRCDSFCGPSFRVAL
jgi:hypothetical protein